MHDWLSEQTGQNYRLPTEAEWEYAARAGTNTKYWWGNEIGANQANCDNDHCKDNFEYTAPVGSFMANPFGLYDTVGNVWEWTCSEYENRYQGKEKRCVSDAGLFALRGGSWDFDAGGTRAANRGGGGPTGRGDVLGARLARQ
jgi:formylglycine-generating enzyme required for sulfatase activity